MKKFKIIYWMEGLWEMYRFEKIIIANSLREAQKKAEKFLKQIEEKNVFYEVGLLSLEKEKA